MLDFTKKSKQLLYAKPQYIEKKIDKEISNTFALSRKNTEQNYGTFSEIFQQKRLQTLENIDEESSPMTNKYKSKLNKKNIFYNSEKVAQIKNLNLQNFGGPKVLNDGKIINYSIIGSVDRFTKFQEEIKEGKKRVINQCASTVTPMSNRQSPRKKKNFEIMENSETENKLQTQTSLSSFITDTPSRPITINRMITRKFVKKEVTKEEIFKDIEEVKQRIELNKQKEETCRKKEIFNKQLTMVHDFRVFDSYEKTNNNWIQSMQALNRNPQESILQNSDEYRTKNEVKTTLELLSPSCDKLQ